MVLQSFLSGTVGFYMVRSSSTNMVRVPMRELYKAKPDRRFFTRMRMY